MRKELYILIGLLGLSASAIGQICEGNLGENIFTQGDFGRGTANILQINPQIAPSYSYTTDPPPNDGEYMITNDIKQWSSNFVWMEIEDNSPDPDGYMMVVNANYTPGVFYRQEVDGLCENTLYVFSADVYNLKPTGSDRTRPNISFLIDGNIVYESGDVPENERWNTYGFTFTTPAGQTSVTLSLQNNAPGGSGNDLALDNISFRPCGPEALILPTEVANICEDGSPIALEATIQGDQYDNPNLQWQQSFDEGLSWTNITAATSSTYTHTNLAGGYYYYRYLLANDPSNLLNSKCRVISNVKVVFVIPKFYTIVDTLCEGLSFSLGDKTYSATGVYIDSLKTVIGCDSIIDLHLTILPDEQIDAAFEVENPSCSYLEDGRIELLDIYNGVGPYSIYINDEPSLAGGNLSDLSEGIYDYSITDRYGCLFETSLAVEKPIPFGIDFGPDIVVDLGEVVELSPAFSLPVASYQWDPADEVGCETDCETINWIPSRSQTLYMTATSTKGCTAADSIAVQVNKVRKVFIPNAFSPNFDGANDYFTVYGAMPNVTEIEELMIFDRWGGLVFEKAAFLPNEPNIGWDGSFRGKVQDKGIYTYVTKVRFLDQELVVYSGSISLIR